MDGSAEDSHRQGMRDIDSSLQGENRPKRNSHAQKVFATARAKQAQAGNIASLPSTRLERKEVDGKSTLVAVFVGKGGKKPQQIDLTYMLDFPGMCELLSRGFLAWGAGQAPLTREETSRRLSNGWLRYIRDQYLTTLPSAKIDGQVMAGFKVWLNHRKTKGGKPLSPGSIRHALGALRVVLDGAGVIELLDAVPPGPRGANRKVKPTEVLRLEQLMHVWAAAEREILALRDRWSRGRELLELGRLRLAEGAELESRPGYNEAVESDPNLALVLAMLDHRYPGVIPDIPSIQSDDPLLGNTVKLAIGAQNISCYFYPTGRDLVPLALALSFATIFNPDTLLKLEWKNIDRNVDRIGNGQKSVRFDVADEGEDGDDGDDDKSSVADGEGPLLQVLGEKPRARRQLVRLLDPEAAGANDVSLNLVLDLLAEMTARIRPYTVGQALYADRIFLFVQVNLEKRPKSFGTDVQSASADIVWQRALKNFIADNKLPHFTLKTIRATLLDYVQLFNRGDLEAARDVGNHRSRVTTWTHYTSSLVKRLLQEATGETLLVRERWIGSKGIIEPRQFRQWTNKGCATPGFICLDPFDSPRPNQTKGRLCSAYGECPDCPLSAGVPGNARNVMLYESLRRAIFRSVSSMTASMWQLRWAPVVAALDSLLALVPEDVLTKSREIVVELPTVG